MVVLAAVRINEGIHVCLAQVNALVLGTTHRYKNKYVTTVVYKPRRRASSMDAQPNSSDVFQQQQQQQQQDFH